MSGVGLQKADRPAKSDALDTGLDAVKGLVFAELAKERPDLYRQLAEYVDGKKATGITEGG